MKLNKIIYIVLAFLLLYSVIQLSTIRLHMAEINKLRTRVANLETVINNIHENKTDKNVSTVRYY